MSVNEQYDMIVEKAKQEYTNAKEQAAEDFAKAIDDFILEALESSMKAYNAIMDEGSMIISESNLPEEQEYAQFDEWRAKAQAAADETFERVVSNRRREARDAYADTVYKAEYILNKTLDEAKKVVTGSNVTE